MENAICNLELQVLTKIYSAKKVTKKALAGVSFTLGPGLYGLLGPNGAGKSTMTVSYTHLDVYKRQLFCCFQFISL